MRAVSKETADNPEEVFIIVDAKDKILGYYTRYECHRSKELIHRAIGVVILNDKEEILLQKRSKGKDIHPGFYTMSVSGHVNRGETYRAAASRELFEELGIKIPLQKKIKFLLEMPNETEMDTVFIAKYNGPFYPNDLEVDEVEFVSKTKLKKMKKLLTPFAKYTFERINLL